MNFNYIDFLCWVDKGIFPNHLANDLEKLGMDKVILAFHLNEWKLSDNTEHNFKILRLYQIYCVGGEVEKGNIGYYLKKWLDKQYIQWLKHYYLNPKY